MSRKLRTTVYAVFSRSALYPAEDVYGADTCRIAPWVRLVQDTVTARRRDTRSIPLRRVPAVLWELPSWRSLFAQAVVPGQWDVP